MDRLDRLKTFVAVAERGSFAEAARQLRLSPAAATRAIAALEDELGVPLLRRTTRSVRLTDEGAAYLDRSRRVLDELEDAARSLRGERAEPRGILVITAPVMFGRMHILPVIGRLMREHRELQVRLMLSDRLVRLVDGGIDVAVRIAALADSALHAVKVGEVRRLLVASPAYLKARGNPRAPGELAGHDIVAVENLSLNNEWRFAGASRRAVRFAPRLLVNSVDAAIAAAVDGLGVTRVLSYQVAGLLEAGQLRCILAEFAPACVPVNLLFQANRQRTPNARAFLVAARAHFKESPLIAGVTAPGARRRARPPP
jgi:DNA-binding transcriptional LysR family regulator